MSEVVGPTDINSCIFADVTPMDYNDNVSKLNLIIEVTSEECIDELAQGTLYVRGLCVASNINGATSETFVLDVVGSDKEVGTLWSNNEQKFQKQYFSRCLTKNGGAKVQTGKFLPNISMDQKIGAKIQILKFSPKFLNWSILQNFTIDQKIGAKIQSLAFSPKLFSGSKIGAKIQILVFLPKLFNGSENRLENSNSDVFSKTFQ